MFFFFLCVCVVSFFIVVKDISIPLNFGPCGTLTHFEIWFDLVGVWEAYAPIPDL